MSSEFASAAKQNASVASLWRSSWEILGVLSVVLTIRTQASTNDRQAQSSAIR